MLAGMISHYRVVRRLGAGGMGEVLLAEDTQLERPVAIKLMSAALAKDPVQRQRFRSEAKAASGLAHPNICIIHEVGETEDGRPFLAMEYVEGQTLDRIEQQRRPSLREVINLGIQIAEALQAAHDRQLVHRDIKPANIMLDKRGRVKILDFGLAKHFARDGLGDTTTLSSALTQPGMLIGTPHYMSPEQVLGRELDHRSDIFSLGVVLYEAVAGQKPFLGKTVGETINNVINQPPAALELQNPVLSPALDGIIFKCLEKNPNDRYAAAGQIAAELGQLKHGTEHVSASEARLPAAAATAAIAPAPPADQTKLWQLAGKYVRPVDHAVTVVVGLIFLAVAAAFGFHMVPGSGGRLAILLTAAAIGVLAGYGWFRRRAPLASSRRQPQPPEAESQPAGWSPPSGGDRPAAQQKSLAVLPFANFSAEKDSDYLSDGLTEEITSVLSRLPGLRVAARNSAFAFKGLHEDARKIGEALRVTMLLEGSVRKAGRQLRITAQLIKVADGYHVWSESFDRDMDDVLAVQDEIARRIAERLSMEIGAETSAAMAQRKSANPEAHVLYLQARQAWNKRTLADIERAVQLFQQAIDKDPAYADAHAGLAACYVVLPGYAYRPAAEYLPLARRAAARALELDATSAEAHAVLGDAASQARDFENSLPHLRRALELNPNYATGHQWYGEALVELGRMAEALVEFRKAEELDPLSPIIRSCIPEWFYLAGRNDEAIAESKMALALFPEFPTLRRVYAQALLRKGMYLEALAEVNRARAGAPGAPARLDLLVFCQARLGNEVEARRILAELEDWRKQGYDVDEEIGCAHVGLRQYDQALDAFERFVDSGILAGRTFRNPLLMDELGTHPRYQALLRQVGLPPPESAAKANRLSRPVLVGGIVIVLALLAFGSWVGLRRGNHPAAQGATDSRAVAKARVTPKSVAVLPFDNFSAEKDTEYLSDGLTEEITAALSRLPGLKVAARNSAFTFKGRKGDLRKVGAALGVATLLDGSLRKVGRQVRVTAQLINAVDGFYLWSESYDRSIDDIFALQEDIARGITERLQGRSAPARHQVIAPEAHTRYLQGRLFWNKRTEAGLKKAIELFQQAIEADPTYAAAHAALASSYMLLPQYSVGLRASQYWPLVRASANRALALNPSCAEAHAVLAMVLDHERDHPAAEQHFQSAIQSDPNYATGHHWYGLSLEMSGRREQGLAELQKALELDPLSPIIHSTIPEWHYLGRDYDRAIAEARKVSETFPDFPAARLGLVLPLIQKRQLREALAEIEKARALQPDQPLALLHLKGFCLARLGQETEARKILADFERLRQEGKPMEGAMAMIHQGLREYDKECELAEQVRLTEGLDEMILIDPEFDELRHLPQFQALLQRAGLTNPPAP